MLISILAPDESLFKDPTPPQVPQRPEEGIDTKGAPRRPPRPCSVQKSKENLSTHRNAATIK